MLGGGGCVPADLHLGGGGGRLGRRGAGGPGGRGLPVPIVPGLPGPSRPLPSVAWRLGRCRSFAWSGRRRHDPPARPGPRPAVAGSESPPVAGRGGRERSDDVAAARDAAVLSPPGAARDRPPAAAGCRPFTRSLGGRQVRVSHAVIGRSGAAWFTRHAASWLRQATCAGEQQGWGVRGGKMRVCVRACVCVCACVCACVRACVRACQFVLSVSH